MLRSIPAFACMNKLLSCCERRPETRHLDFQLSVCPMHGSNCRHFADVSVLFGKVKSDVPLGLRGALSIAQTSRDVRQGYIASLCALHARAKWLECANPAVARIRASITVLDIASFCAGLHGFVPRLSGHYRQAFRSRL